MGAGRKAQLTTSSRQMESPGRTTQRFAVALLMATLLGPLSGGLAGHQVGMDMGENDCAEHDSSEPRRCAGLWSTACCDYFAPGSKIKVEPLLESSSHASDALPIGAVAEVLEPAAIWTHLILPTAGAGRTGPTSLVILHSALLR